MSSSIMDDSPSSSSQGQGLKPPSKPPTRPSSRTGPSASSQTAGFCFLPPQQVAENLRTSLTRGLNASEATSRILDCGPNELPHEESEPLWLRFVKQFQETLILLLLGSAAVSILLGNTEDAISIAIAVIIVVTVGFVQEYRSEKSLEALNQLVPHSAFVIRSAGATNGRAAGKGIEGIELEDVSNPDKAFDEAQASSTTIQASQLVPGDLVLFHTGDRIPADIRITQSADLSVDESNLTGENEAVSKSSTTLDRPAVNGQTPFYSANPTSAGAGDVDMRLHDQHNIVFMGTLVRSGYGQGIVVSTGANTEFGAISASLQGIESPRTPLQLSMDRLGKDLSYMSFGVIGFILLVGLLRGWKFLEMFQIGVSLAVAAIPEGLPIIVTVTLALGVLRMSRRNAIVRRLPSVETLGSVNVVCSDKTGTLTTNHMTVTKIWHFDDEAPEDVLRMQGHTNLDPATTRVIRIANIVNNGRLTDGDKNSTASLSVLSSTMGDDPGHAKSRWVGQPTDVALLDLLDLLGEEDVRPRLGAKLQETPFSSDKKWMGAVIQGSDAEHGSDVAYLKGALERVLSRCDTYITKEGKEIVLDEKRRQDATKAANAMAQEGLRVLAFASGPLPDAKAKALRQRNSSTANTKPSSDTDKAADDLYNGLAFAGLVGMNDPPRKGVDRSIRRLMAGGVKVIMITGDSETTAVAIGKKLGMPITNSTLGQAVLKGSDIDAMSHEQLTAAVATTTIFARTSPAHKLRIIDAFQARGDVVAMTGDGVNDAPALKKANIGISMGLTGTDVAKEAADMILTDDDFSTILNAIEEGKGIFYNIQNFITFQLSTSAAALSLVLLATCFGLKNPLNAMQILWINILMDGPPAQSLGVEPVDPAVMSRPPRRQNARVLTPPLLRRVAQSASIIMLGTLAIYIHEMAHDGIVTKRDTTMTFTAFVLFDMFNALTCRSESKSVLRGDIKFLGNKMFNLAVSGSLLGQAMVVYFPPLQRVFQTEALALSDWIGLVLVASTVFWADEGRKWLKTRRKGGMGGYSTRV